MRQWINHLREFGFLLCILALSLAALSPLAVSAGGATLSFNPNPIVIPYGQTFGTITINWDSGDGSVPEYYVSTDGLPDGGPFPFITTPSGSYTVANGVVYGHTYVGKLYTKGKGKLLVQTTLTTTHQGVTTCGAACNVPPGPPQSLTLTPTKILTTEMSDIHVDEYVYCGLPTQGLGGLDVTTLSNEIVAGFDYYYDPGTDPFPCTEKSDQFYRGGVGFNMGAIGAFASAHGIKSATLAFRLSGGPACLARIEVSDDEWESWTPGSHDFLPSGPLHTNPPTLNTSGGIVDVTDIVALQVAFASSHGHFVFIGNDEGFPENNDVCLAHYSGFVLTLTPEH